MKSKVLGQHYLVDLFDCELNLINSHDHIRASMLEAARIAQATIVAEVFHEFNPHGISGVVVIAESHLAIHSWPEYRCVSVDLFTCSDQMEPDKAIEYLSRVFKAQRADVQKVSRGQIGPDCSSPISLIK